MRLQINYRNKNMSFYENVSRVETKRDAGTLVFIQDAVYTIPLEYIYEFYIDNRVYAVNYCKEKKNNE